MMAHQMGNTCSQCRLTFCRDRMSAGLNMTGGRISLSDRDRRFCVEIPNFGLDAGQAVAITGASGSGKTLILEVLGLLRAPDSDTEYHAGDVDLVRLWDKGPRSVDLAKTRGRLFGFVPQTGGLLPFLTVAENVHLSQKVNRVDEPAWCSELLDKLGLADQAALLPEALSIGQRQRTAIARALAHRPKFVIADEPTSALDPETADQVLTLFLDLADEQETGVILSSHDLERLDRHGIIRRALAVQAGDPVVSRLENA